MSITEVSLMSQVAREVGDVDESNLYFSSSRLFSSINDGISDANERHPTQQYGVVGTGATAYITPEPSKVDQRLIVLFAALCLTRGEIQKSARTAIVHSNPAGRTDLSKVTDALEKGAERLEKKIERVLTIRRMVEVEKDIVDNGESMLRSRDISEPVYAEGLPIVTIKTQV